MKTVGQKLDPFHVTGVKPGFNHHEENGASAFEDQETARARVHSRASAAAVRSSPRTAPGSASSLPTSC